MPGEGGLLWPWRQGTSQRLHRKPAEGLGGGSGDEKKGIKRGFKAERTPRAGWVDCSEESRVGKEGFGCEADGAGAHRHGGTLRCVLEVCGGRGRGRTQREGWREEQLQF